MTPLNGLSEGLRKALLSAQPMATETILKAAGGEISLPLKPPLVTPPDTAGSSNQAILIIAGIVLVTGLAFIIYNNWSDSKAKEEKAGGNNPTATSKNSYLKKEPFMMGS